MKYFTLITTLFAMLLCQSCGTENLWSDYFGDGGYVLDNTHANVIRKYEFVTEAEDGSAEGFDVDGRVSEQYERESCGHGDYVDAEGRPGIDNALARISDDIAPLVGDTAETLVGSAVNEGRMLVIIELEGLDDFVNDDDVTLRFFRARGAPPVGQKDLLAPDSTLYIDPRMPMVTLEGLSVIDGELLTPKFDYDMPIEALEASFSMAVEHGRIRLKIHEDGSFTGVLGGATNFQDTLNYLYTTDGSQEAELITPIFSEYADMQRVDGTCELFSFAFAFEGTTAFIVRYPDSE